jgi:hypothetical protein
VPIEEAWHAALPLDRCGDGVFAAAAKL